MDTLRLFCSVNVAKPPQERLVSNNEETFIYNVGPKIPKHIIVYTLGSWDSLTKLHGSRVTLQVNLKTRNKDVLYIGRLSYLHRCLCWEAEWTPLSWETLTSNDATKVYITLEADTKPRSLVFNEKTENTVETARASTPRQKRTDQSPVNKLKRTPRGNSERKRRARISTHGTTPNKTRSPGRLNAIMTDATSDDKENLSDVSEDLEISFKSSAVEDSTGDEVEAVVTKLTPTGSLPTSRWGHTLSMLGDTTAVLIGGQGEGSLKGLRKDSLWLFDAASNQWTALENKSQTARPDVRMGHAAVYDPTLRCVYVYGGSKNLRWFNDVHFLEIDEWKWEAVQVDGKAPTRSYHSMTLYRHELWVFGGVYPQPQDKADSSSNDIHVFSLINKNWYSPIVMGDKPSPRSGHSATLLEDQLVVFGGWDFPVVFNDLYILDMGLVEWRKPKTHGKPPSVRSWHSACTLSGNNILIHGGYNGDLALSDSFIFNLDTLTWTEVCMTGGIETRCRTGHAGFCLPYSKSSAKKDKVYIFGGGDNNDAYYNDVFTITLPAQGEA